MKFLNSFNPYFLTGLFFAFFLTYYFVEKLNKNSHGYREKLGCFPIGVIFLVISILLLISSLSIKSLKLLENAYTSEKYDATIVRVESFEVENEEGEYIKMFSPVVQFKPKNTDTVLVKNLLISSSKQYKINQSHKVCYNRKTGEIYSAEKETIFMFLMMFLFSVLAILAISYIFYFTFIK